MQLASILQARKQTLGSPRTRMRRMRWAQTPSRDMPPVVSKQERLDHELMRTTKNTLNVLVESLRITGDVGIDSRPARQDKSCLPGTRSCRRGRIPSSRAPRSQGEAMAKHDINRIRFRITFKHTSNKSYPIYTAETQPIRTSRHHIITNPILPTSRQKPYPNL